MEFLSPGACKELILTFSIKCASNCGESIKQQVINPKTRNMVYISLVPVDSLIGLQHREHSPHDAGPKQHPNCKKK